MKLTKAQAKNQERIAAWLHETPFRENAREKPQVPQLPIEDVLEQFCPPNMRIAGQFFTPLEMASHVLAYVVFAAGDRILEPCGGIGNLLYPLWRYRDMVQLEVYEQDGLCAQIGQRLFPWANWHAGIPFEHLNQLEGRYDYVLMNPPYGTKAGMDAGISMCAGRATRSEHVFVELAIRALKPEGIAVLIVPSSGPHAPAFHETFPRKLRQWFDERAQVMHRDARLPGRFQFTNMGVEALLVMRKDYDVPAQTT